MNDRDDIWPPQMRGLVAKIKEPPIWLVSGHGITVRLYQHDQKRGQEHLRRKYAENKQFAFAYYEV